jgi:hypothetical protein
MRSAKAGVKRRSDTVKKWAANFMDPVTLGDVWGRVLYST